MRDDGLGVGPPPRVLGGDHGERRAGGGTLNADEVATAWPVLPRWAAAGSTQQCLARGSRRWVPVPAWNDGIVASTPLRRARAAISFHALSGAKLKFSLAPACWCFAHAKTN